jgi:dTDP-4-amino-4,6-dideoxygalactose transaminase
MPDLALIAATFLLALAAIGCGLGLGLYSTRARNTHRSPAERLRDEAEAAAAQEKLEEVAETIERRRKRVEVANQRAAQRELQHQPSEPEDGASVAHLSVQDQLAWAAKRTKHRPFGGGLQ